MLGCGNNKANNSDGYYTKIDEQEISIILKLVDHEGVINLSKVIKVGKKVIISSGPLTNLEGIIRAVNLRKRRVKIAINLRS